MKCKVKKVKRGRRMICDPGGCDHCIYVGEGDFLCDNTDDEAYVVVMSDWEPTEQYPHCLRKREGGRVQ